VRVQLPMALPMVSVTVPPGLEEVSLGSANVQPSVWTADGSVGGAGEVEPGAQVDPTLPDAGGGRGRRRMPDGVGHRLTWVGIVARRVPLPVTSAPCHLNERLVEMNPTPSSRP
jgi:hypothetical protein